MSFHSIIGNDPIKELLRKTVQSNQVSHSYMMIGIEGIGKSLFAKEFSQMLLCLAEDTPCGNCKSCVEFTSKNHPDFYELAAEETTIKIEQIRMLQSKLLEKPITAKRKVYIIKDADNMTKEAQNCLLKTLEEPPEYVSIILTVSNESQILNTIKSRCMKIYFHPIEDHLLQDFLEKTGEGQEKITPAYIKACQGSIAKALRIRENRETYDQIEKLCNHIKDYTLLDVLGKIEVLYQKKEDIEELLDYMNTIFLERAKEDQDYLSYMQAVEETKRKLKANGNYDMCIDSLLLSIFDN